MHKKYHKKILQGRDGLHFIETLTKDEQQIGKNSTGLFNTLNAKNLICYTMKLSYHYNAVNYKGKMKKVLKSGWAS